MSAFSRCVQKIEIVSFKNTCTAWIVSLHEKVIQNLRKTIQNLERRQKDMTMGSFNVILEQ